MAREASTHVTGIAPAKFDATKEHHDGNDVGLKLLVNSGENLDYTLAEACCVLRKIDLYLLPMVSQPDSAVEQRLIDNR